MVLRAPDYAAPVIGWRTWTIVEEAGRFSLRSVYFPTSWPVRRELVAECLRPPGRQLFAPWRRREPHDGPVRRCDCGIYAARTAKRAVTYFDDDGLHWRPLNRVIGLVALWGSIVECELGWRAERAYPVRIYLPWYTIGVRDDADRVACDLGRYGVPVEVLRCDGRRELGATLVREAAGDILPRAS